MEDAAFLANFQFLARYNGWINERLYAAGGSLPDEERRRERGAFFGSIHRTLNHILWADRLWLQRFAAQGVDFPALRSGGFELPQPPVYGVVLYENWDELRERRFALDAAIEGWLREMPASFLVCTMRYANMKGVDREHAAWKSLTHFFNHQTHHRGQVTTLLSQAGVDVGITDLIALAQE
jgi:uncharacterized damage-inducible protein DinB